MQLGQIEQIKPNLMVHAKAVERPSSMDGVPGVHVGTVDHLEGLDYIKLKRSDSPDGRHHWIPIDWVEGVDDKAVYLNKTPEEVSRGLLNENPHNRH